MSELQRAILYMLFSAIFSAFMNVILRKVNYFPTFELVFFSSLGSVILCFIFLLKNKISLIGNNPSLLTFRGFVGATSLILFYESIQIMPLASAVSLRYLSPFFAAVLAIFLLGEKMLKIQWLFFITAFLGVILLKGFDPRISAYALACILASAFASGTVYVLIRQIGTSEHPLVLMHYFASISTLIGGFLCLFKWQTPQDTEWIWLFSLGILGFIAQYFMTIAMQTTQSNLITPFKYAEVICTLFTAWLFFGEYQTYINLFAIGIIILSLIANVWVKQPKTPKQPHTH